LGDEVIGLLCADNSKVGAYNEEDAQMAFALASQAAQAIRNARLFDEVRRFAAELEQRVIERTAALAEANTQLSEETERLQAIRISDVRKDKRWLREEGRAAEVRSVVAVPLRTTDGPLGALILTSSKINYFSDAQLQLLTTIANEVAIVIHNAELYSFINDLATRLGEALAEQREESSKRQAILQ